ncbi:MAG: acyl-CoA dehydrogenase family protein [Acidobacteriota bacterium]|nr:acyl-CoA dehydrogenase family protein [Acidobacteriota bacterium]
MDFNDTPEQAEFRAEARAWLAANAPRFENSRSRGISGAASADDVARAKEWQALKAEAGWAGLHWPEAYGGRSLSRLHVVIYGQEESRYAVPSAFFVIGLNFCGPTMMEYATEEDKRRYLPKLLSGEEIWCQLFSEPVAGSDLAGLRTRADRDGDDWVINGQKIWNTYAHLADYGIMVTRHDPTLPKHKGLTYFFLDMHSAGVEPRPIKQIAGTSNFNEVFFTNVRIPDNQRLGEIGEGWSVALTTLMNERLGAASAALPPDVAHVLDLSRRVEIDGEPALQNAAVRQRLADWYIESKGLELVGARMVTALAQGATPGPEASIRKVVTASKTQSIASFGIDLQEMAGVLLDDAPDDALFQDAFLQSPGSRIAGGSDEILRNIIAERVLQLPGDIRVDRDVAFKDIPVNS